LEKLNEARVELGALQEVNKRSADKLARTVIRAPATGIVKTVHVTTIGQVVQPGIDLIEIVPLNDTLLIETRIRPQDIAFLRPGQLARVKLTAYDFALYGGLEGEVENIGADSVTDDKGETYYLIQIRTNGVQLEHGGKDLPVIPGMVAQVDVLTGEKTVLAYLTKPLTRMRDEALRER
ncbi:MAG: HlyD family type I secretion periplasmic adaptor subunit, partial [Pseudomonadota bacterium]